MDECFLLELQAFYNNKFPLDECHIEAIRFESDWYEEFIAKSSRAPHIIYITFPIREAFGENENYFYDALIVMKRNLKMRSTAIVGIFENKRSLQSYQNFIACGLLYTTILRESFYKFLCDTCYIAYGRNVGMPVFARATKINCTFELTSLASIVAFDSERLLIDTDIQNEEAILHARMHLFDDFKAETFEVTQSFPTPQEGYFDYSYQVAIPYCGPWDEVTEKTIEKDTVETWLDFNRPDFNVRRDCFFVIDQDASRLYTINRSFQSKEIYAFCKDDFNSDFACIETLRPFMIWLNFGHSLVEGQSENDYDPIYAVIKYILGCQNYQPIIVLYDCPSGGEAVNKVYGYPKMITTQNFPTVAVLNEITNIYFAKKGQEGLSKSMYAFHFNDPRRVCEIPVEIEITNLTEHEITFYCKKALPFFMVMRCTVPVEMLITIVPPWWDLPITVSKGHHYMALINGVSMDDEKILRKFVNQIIFSPISEFKYVEQYNEEKDVLMSREEYEAKQQQNAEESREENREVVARHIGNRRSKL